MRGKRVVRFGGWVFASHLDHHGSGNHVLRKLKDWRGGSQWRREEIGRPVAAGAFDIPGYLPQRVVTIEGTLLASSAALLQHQIRGLEGFGTDGEKFRVMVDDDHGTTWRDVRLAQSASVDERDETTADFVMSLWAADPRAYGESRTFLGGESAYHYGTSSAIPTLEVTGVYPSGYTVSIPGKSFVVTQALTAGQTHRIDMRTGWLYRDNVLQSGAVSRAETWVIPPGQEVTHSITGAGVLTVTVVDTY